MTPLAFTASYLAGSSNMMSNVSSNGPAFLLRMTFASLLSADISHSRYRFCLPRRSLVPDLDHLHREDLAWVLQRQQVVDRELVGRPDRNIERREWVGEVAGGIEDAGEANMLQRAAHIHGNPVGKFL